MRGARAVVVLALVFAACAQNDAPEAYFWRVRDMVSPQDADGTAGELVDFGGWKPRQLLAKVGTPLFFEENTDAGTSLAALNDGLVVQPGVSGGASAPFVITEVWKNHPVPWVQPVWVPRFADGGIPDGSVNVFSVDDDSTFYSPFWQLEVVVSDELLANNAGFGGARDVLATMADAEHFTGPLVYCPLVPNQTYFAQTSRGLFDPVTRQPLRQMDPKKAVVEGFDVFYRDFGPDRFSANNQLPIAAKAYFWVTREGEPVLPLAAVLPSQPKSKSFVTRVDMRLPATAGVYVPTARAELREKLLGLGVRVPVPLLANDGRDARALQVTLNPDCFVDAGIDTCVFIDSEAAVFQSGVWTNEQPVQLAIGVLAP